MLVLTALSACNGARRHGPGRSGSAATDPGNQHASHAFTPATAGTLEFPTGGSLFVPAGVVVAAVTISVDVRAPTAALPDRTTLVGSVYELGPPGLTFASGSAAYIALPTGTLPARKTAVISTRAPLDAAWSDLPTIVSGGVAYAAVPHLSPFVVRLADVNDALCASFDTSCGTGNVVGTWRVVAFCNGDDSPVPPLLAACSAVVPTSTVASTGAITLMADLTFRDNITNPYATTATASLPASCLAGHRTCADVATAIVGDRATYLAASCTGAPTTACDCTAVRRPPIGSGLFTGPYTVAGGQLGFPSVGIPARPYCVSGGRFSLSWGSKAGIQFGFLMVP